MSQHEGTCSRGGGSGGGGCPRPGCCLQARDRYSPRPGCCVQARDKICDPAPRSVLEGGVRRVRGGSPPRHGCCVQARDRLLCPSTRPAAVSKHETDTVTKQTTGARGGSGGASSPGTAAVSKHETDTVTKQTTGALQFMVAFALRGGGGLLHLREYISLRCALGGGSSVPKPAPL